MNKQEFITKIAKYVKKYANSYGIKVHSPYYCTGNFREWLG